MVSINCGPVPNGAGPYYLFQITYHFPTNLVISGAKNARPHRKWAKTVNVELLQRRRVQILFRHNSLP